MKTEWLEYLVAFKNYKSINKVAEFCHTTPQNVGKIFRHLEEEMDCELFDRSKRFMVLTEAGKALAETAEMILSSLQSVKDKYSNSNERNVLNGNIELIGDNIEILNNILYSFNSQYPEVNVSFQEADMKSALKTIAENSDKIGFIPFSEGYSSQKIIKSYEYILNFYPLSIGKSVCVCSRESVLANHQNIKWSDLADMKFAVLSKNVSGDNFLNGEILKEKIGVMTHPIITNSSNYFYSNIAKNIFVGLTTELEFTNCSLQEKRKLLAIPIKDAGLHKNFLVYHNNKKFNNAEKTLVTMIGKYYRNNLK